MGMVAVQSSLSSVGRRINAITINHYMSSRLLIVNNLTAFAVVHMQTK